MLKYNIQPGEKHHYLTVIRVGFMHNGYSSIEVKCICGTVKILNRGNFIRGTKSCGCMRSKLISEQRIIHGDSKHCKQQGNKRLYRIWSGMKERVLTPYKEKDKKHYKDRGISICSEWKKSYLKFKNWALQNGYQDNLTIDRINNDGNYCPENCRWVTHKEQNINRKPFILKRDKKGRFTKNIKEDDMNGQKT